MAPLSVHDHFDRSNCEAFFYDTVSFGTKRDSGAVRRVKTRDGFHPPGESPKFKSWNYIILH